jgi:hypothetical protein
MKVTGKFELLSLLFVVTLFAQNARSVSVPVGSTMEDSDSTTFVIGSGSAVVNSNVYYGYTSGPYQDKYVYTYQITNNSGLGLSSFSVGIFDGANAFAPDVEEAVGTVSPTYWTTVATPVQSVHALFADITVGDGESSAILWFVSDYTSTSGNGALYCMSSGFPYYATGDVLTPIPEPATIMLLGVGGLMTLTRKRKVI